MAEQELVKKKKKKFAGRPFDELYESEEFLEKLDEYYSTYGTFELTAKKLTEDFERPITYSAVAKVYKKHMANKVEDKKEFFKNSFKRMQKRWEDSWEMIGDLVTEYKKMKRVIKDKSPDDLTQALTFMKMSNQIIQIAGEIRKQLEFIRKEQEEIKVYQQNNLIITPVQVNQQIIQTLSKMSEEEFRNLAQSIKDERIAQLGKLLNSKNDK